MYRRYGHNELDQPAFTQPLMYQVIAKTKPVFDKYAEKLVKEGVMTQQQVDEATVDAPTVVPISTDMEVELEKTENDIILDVIPQENVKVNEDTPTTEPNTIVEEPQIQDENKLTESE